MCICVLITQQSLFAENIFNMEKILKHKICMFNKFTSVKTLVENLVQSQSQTTFLPLVKKLRLYNEPPGTETSGAKRAGCLVSCFNYFSPFLTANTVILLGPI